MHRAFVSERVETITRRAMELMHDEEQRKTQTAYWKKLGSSRLMRDPTVPALLVFALVIWIAHFWSSAQFGLYEDDWYRVPKTLGIGWHGLWTLILTSSMPGPSQGRPFHPAFIYLFSFLGFKLGQLRGVYAIAYIIFLSNAVLFYFFLRKAFSDDRLAFLGTLSFCVFPADTTQPFLTHALGVQPSITLVLIAFHCYLGGWKKTSYLAALLVLFTYETPFLLFAAAPLLQRDSKRGFIKHCALLASLFVCVVLFRATTAETRVSQIGHRDLLLGCLNVIVGPVTCLVMYVYRPVETLFKLTVNQAALLICCWMGLALVLITRVTFKVPPNVDRDGVKAPATSLLASSGSRPLLIGSFFLFAAYPLTLTTTGIAVAGRGTRVHTAAVLGASILVAWLCCSILSRSRGRTGKYGAPIAVATFFALLVGFGLNVQKDYVVGWQEQRGFWTDLMALCPDLEDGDVILVEPTGLRDTRQLSVLRRELTGVPESRQIKSLDVLYDVLPELYGFPTNWKQPPRVFRLPLNWQKNIFGDDDRLRLLTIEAGYSYFATSRTTTPASKVIFVDTKDGHLARRTTLSNPEDGRKLLLKQDSGAPNNLEKAAIFPYVVMRPSYPATRYLVR
jgi:hypothetical protein